MLPELILTIIVIAFVMEFIDAFAGMGFGIVTPILVLMGYSPHEVVFAVLVNSAILSLSAGIFHHIFKNVRFTKKSKSSKISKLLVLFGLFSILLGVIIAVEISDTVLKAYIGAIFIIMGFVLLFMHKLKLKFSWKKLIGIGSFASINKGITGGGFGPVLTAGQIISGVKVKNAVGISSLVEGIISTAGVFFYLLLAKLEYLNWSLMISLMIGGLASTPLAAFTVKKIQPKGLKLTMAIFCIILGILTILKI